jgi:hypothetical protein
MKQKLKPWLYALVLILLHSRCEKKDPSACGQGGPNGDTYRYIKTIKNVRADLSQNAFFVIEGGDAPNICPSQYPQFATYENTYTFNQPQPYKYRIWGRIFNCDSCPTAVIGSVPMIVIDKIEKIN